MSNEEKKSCHNCAYLSESGMVLGPKWDTSLKGVGHTIGEPTVLSFISCKQKNPSFNEKDLVNNSCEKFLRKKQGMTLEQQLEEQIKEQKEREELAEQARLKKEHDRLPIRLRRNWYYVSALLIGIIGLVIAIWRFLLNN